MNHFPAVHPLAESDPKCGQAMRSVRPKNFDRRIGGGNFLPI